MPKYIFHLSDGMHADMELDARDNNEAFGTAIDSLATFVSMTSPPPTRVEIQVLDANRRRLATFRFEADIVGL